MTTSHTRRRSLGIIGICAAATAALVLAPNAAVGDDSTITSTFTLDEKASSGITGDATVTDERVLATADGFDPDERYVSFFYGANSQSDGPTPCILDGSIVLPSQVNVGEWDVAEDGEGTLDARNPTGDVVGALSIRRVGHEQDDAFAIPLNPVTYPLVACGRVANPQSPIFDTLDDSGASLPVKIPTQDVPDVGAPGVSAPRVIKNVTGG